MTDEYEIHITVTTGNAPTIERLMHFAEDRQLKFTHILLDRGVYSSQPMLTGHCQGSITDAMACAKQIDRALVAARFTATRVKVEAAPWNADVPGDATAPGVLSHDRYFEHHVKLLMGRDTDVDRLTTIAQRHNAHLSRNARRVRSDGQQERFVTQRCFGVGRREAQVRFDALLQDLAPLEVPILDSEQEYVVYDSNIGLDAGWIAETA